jgi:tetratricopeptide (TPR) repeat protein
MALTIRREQGLLAVTLLLAVWIWSGTSAATSNPRATGKSKNYEAPATPARTRLERLANWKPPGRDAFVEPSESAPLPPRPLPPPELSPLPVVLPPLLPGVDPAVYRLVRVAGGVVEPYQFPGAGGEAPGGAPAEGAASAPGSQPTPPRAAAAPAAMPPGNLSGSVPGNGAAAQDTTAPELTYDRVEMVHASPMWGRVRNENRFELEARVGPYDQSIFFDWMNPRNGSVTMANLELKGPEVKAVLLAKTLRNEIERRKRRLGGAMRDRIRFVEWLLMQARETPWVYAEAEKQARDCIKLDNNSVLAHGLVAAVLRERGEPGAEYEFFKTLPEQHQGSAFQLRGLGRIKARVALFDAAEQDLRAALQKDKDDPRSRLELAAFLLARGRAGEAFEHADVARRGSAQLDADTERLRCAETVIGCLLALGRPQEAEPALALLPESESFSAHRSYLRGAIKLCIAQARAESKAMFQAGLSGPAGAALGLGVLQCLDKEWALARASLQSVTEQAPLLRHRALAALAFLYDRTGNAAEALARAEEAVVAHPRDPYVLYLLGRTRRVAGQLEPAVDALRAALAQNDECVEALGEIALAHLALAERDAVNAAEHLTRAALYADRAVELERRHAASEKGSRVEPRYLELQGLVHLRATDWPQARAAFQAGAADSVLCEIGLLLVDYAQNRIDEARAQLDALRKRLPYGDPHRTWAEATLVLVDDHDQKVQIRDPFQRTELGNLWRVERNGPVGPRILDGVLVVQGKLPGADVVRASRELEKSGAFLRAEVTLWFGPEHEGAPFCGLVLTSRGPGAVQGTPEFSARLGCRDRQPLVQVEDGNQAHARDDEKKNFEPVLLARKVDPAQPNRLALEVFPLGADDKRFVLKAFWNGDLVHERPLNRLSRGTQSPLLIDLRVEGRPGTTVHVRFDDYRLERRKGE